MEQGFGVTVQGLHGVVGIVTLLGVVEGYEEGSLLDGVQRLLVLTAAEVGVPALCPRGPAASQRETNLGLTSLQTKPSRCPHVNHSCCYSNGCVTVFCKVEQHNSSTQLFLSVNGPASLLASLSVNVVNKRRVRCLDWTDPPPHPPHTPFPRGEGSQSFLSWRWL